MALPCTRWRSMWPQTFTNISILPSTPKPGSMPAHRNVKILHILLIQNIDTENVCLYVIFIKPFLVFVVNFQNNSEFRASRRAIKDVLRGKEDSNTVTKRLNHDDLQNVFENEDLSSSLFHQSSVIVDWVPYRPIKSNIPSIFTQTTSVIGSNLCDIDKAFLTFGNHFRIVDGLMFKIDIYGNQCGLIYSHILQHIQNCEDDNVLIQLFYDKNVTDSIVSVVKDLSLSGEDIKYNRLVFVKRVLREK